MNNWAFQADIAVALEYALPHAVLPQLLRPLVAAASGPLPPAIVQTTERHGDSNDSISTHLSLGKLVMGERSILDRDGFSHRWVASPDPLPVVSHAVRHRTVPRLLHATLAIPIPPSAIVVRIIIMIIVAAHCERWPHSVTSGSSLAHTKQLALLMSQAQSASNAETAPSPELPSGGARRVTAHTRMLAPDHAVDPRLFETVRPSTMLLQMMWQRTQQVRVTSSRSAYWSKVLRAAEEVHASRRSAVVQAEADARQLLASTHALASLRFWQAREVVSTGAEQQPRSTQPTQTQQAQHPRGSAQHAEASQAQCPRSVAVQPVHCEPETDPSSLTPRPVEPARCGPNPSPQPEAQQSQLQAWVFLIDLDTAAVVRSAMPACVVPQSVHPLLAACLGPSGLRVRSLADVAPWATALKLRAGGEAHEDRACCCVTVPRVDTALHSTFSSMALLSVDLSDSHDVDDQCLAALPPSCQVARLRNCSRITDSGIRRLLWRLRSLRTLDTRGCKSLSDQSVRATWPVQRMLTVLSGIQSERKLLWELMEALRGLRLPDASFKATWKYVLQLGVIRICDGVVRLNEEDGDAVIRRNDIESRGNTDTDPVGHRSSVSKPPNGIMRRDAVPNGLRSEVASTDQHNDESKPSPEQRVVAALQSLQAARPDEWTSAAEVLAAVRQQAPMSGPLFKKTWHAVTLQRIARADHYDAGAGRCRWENSDEAPPAPRCVFISEASTPFDLSFSMEFARYALSHRVSRSERELQCPAQSVQQVASAIIDGRLSPGGLRSFCRSSSSCPSGWSRESVQYMSKSLTLCEEAVSTALMADQSNAVVFTVVAVGRWRHLLPGLPRTKKNLIGRRLTNHMLAYDPKMWRAALNKSVKAHYIDIADSEHGQEIVSLSESGRALLQLTEKRWAEQLASPPSCQTKSNRLPASLSLGSDDSAKAMLLADFHPDEAAIVIVGCWTELVPGGAHCTKTMVARLMADLFVGDPLFRSAKACRAGFNTSLRTYIARDGDGCDTYSLTPAGKSRLRAIRRQWSTEPSAAPPVPVPVKLQLATPSAPATATAPLSRESENARALFIAEADAEVAAVVAVGCWLHLVRGGVSCTKKNVIGHIAAEFPDHPVFGPDPKECRAALDRCVRSQTIRVMPAQQGQDSLSLTRDGHAVLRAAEERMVKRPGAFSSKSACDPLALASPPESVPQDESNDSAVFMAEKDAVMAAVFAVERWSQMMPKNLPCTNTAVMDRLANYMLLGHRATDSTTELCRAALGRCVTAGYIKVKRDESRLSMRRAGSSFLLSVTKLWKTRAFSRLSTDPTAVLPDLPPAQKAAAPPSRVQTALAQTPSPALPALEGAAAMFMDQSDAVAAAIVVVGCWSELVPKLPCTKGNVISRVTDHGTLLGHPVIGTSAETCRAAVEKCIAEKHITSQMKVTLSGRLKLRAVEQAWSISRAAHSQPKAAPPIAPPGTPSPKLPPMNSDPSKPVLQVAAPSNSAKALFIGEKDAVMAVTVIVGCWSKLTVGLPCTKGNVMNRVTQGALAGHPVIGGNAPACRAALEKCIIQKYVVSKVKSDQKSEILLFLTAAGRSRLRTLEERRPAKCSATSSSAQSTSHTGASPAQVPSLKVPCDVPKPAPPTVVAAPNGSVTSPKPEGNDAVRAMFMAEKDAAVAAVMVVGCWSVLAPGLPRTKGNIISRVTNDALRGHPVIGTGVQCRAALERCITQTLFTITPGPNGAGTLSLNPSGWSTLRAAEKRWSAKHTTAKASEPAPTQPKVLPATIAPQTPTPALAKVPTNTESCDSPKTAAPAAVPSATKDSNDVRAMFMAEKDAPVAAIIVVGHWSNLAPGLPRTKGNIISRVGHDALRGHPVIGTQCRAVLERCVAQALLTVTPGPNGADTLSLTPAGWSKLRAAEKRSGKDATPKAPLPKLVPTPTPRTPTPAPAKSPSTPEPCDSRKTAAFAAMPSSQTGNDDVRAMFMAEKDGAVAAIIVVGCWSKLAPGLPRTKGNIISRVTNDALRGHPVIGTQCRAVLERCVTQKLFTITPGPNGADTFSLTPSGWSKLRAAENRWSSKRPSQSDPPAPVSVSSVSVQATVAQHDDNTAVKALFMAEKDAAAAAVIAVGCWSELVPGGMVSTKANVISRIGNHVDFARHPLFGSNTKACRAALERCVSAGYLKATPGQHGQDKLSLTPSGRSLLQGVKANNQSESDQHKPQSSVAQQKVVGPQPAPRQTAMLAQWIQREQPQRQPPQLQPPQLQPPQLQPPQLQQPPQVQLHEAEQPQRLHQVQEPQRQTQLYPNSVKGGASRGAHAADVFSFFDAPAPPQPVEAVPTQALRPRIVDSAADAFFASAPTPAQVQAQSPAPSQPSSRRGAETVTGRQPVVHVAPRPRPPVRSSGDKTEDAMNAFFK